MFSVWMGSYKFVVDKYLIKRVRWNSPKQCLEKSVFGVWMWHIYTLFIKGSETDVVQTPFVYSTIRGVGSSRSKHLPQVELRGGSTSGGCLLPELHSNPKSVTECENWFDLLCFNTFSIIPCSKPMGAFQKLEHPQAFHFPKCPTRFYILYLYFQTQLNKISQVVRLNGMCEE